MRTIVIDKTDSPYVWLLNPLQFYWFRVSPNQKLRFSGASNKIQNQKKLNENAKNEIALSQLKIHRERNEIKKKNNKTDTQTQTLAQLHKVQFVEFTYVDILSLFVCLCLLPVPSAYRLCIDFSLIVTFAVLATIQMQWKSILWSNGFRVSFRLLRVCVTLDSHSGIKRWMFVVALVRSLCVQIQMEFRSMNFRFILSFSHCIWNGIESHSKRDTMTQSRNWIHTRTTQTHTHTQMVVDTE